MSQHIDLLHEFMDILEQNGTFSGVVLVSDRNQTAFCRGIGNANEEHGIPNGPQTKFRIASISKGFTAAAVLLLCEQGLLSVQDPISRFLPDFPIGDQVTVHQLLTHTSGIPDYVRLADYWTTRMRLPHTLDGLIASISRLPLEFAPGSSFSYSNSNYFLLTKMIETVTGEDYGAFLKHHLLNPLQLHDTGLDEGRSILPHLANGYTIHKEKRHAEFIDMSIPSGAFGLYSTAVDLYRWNQALHTGQLLSPTSLQAMFTPWQATPWQSHYGYGWAIEEAEVGNRVTRLISHFGDINGFCGNLLHFADLELTVIVLSNVHPAPVTQIGKQLAHLWLGSPISLPERTQPCPMPSDDFGPYVGTYQEVGSNKKWIVSAEAKKLYLTSEKMHGVPYTYPLIPVSVSREKIVCKARYLEEKITIHRTASPLRLTVRELDQTFEAVKVDET